MIPLSSSLSLCSSPPCAATSKMTVRKARDPRPSCEFRATPPLLDRTIPLVASISILLWSSPVSAGILSGSKGLESVPSPPLPQIDFLSKWNEENQKRYAELDSKFKSSGLLKEYLEKSRVNKERNDRQTQDKYCLRGAEWGVGDCSTEGMTPEERDAFIAMLKKRNGAE